MKEKIKFPERDKLNLGCSVDYREGWVNVDIDDKDIYGNETKVDVIHDLNKYPYPFKGEQFKWILSIGVLQQMRDLERHIKELSRIIKRGGRLKITTPYFLSYNSAREIYTHRFSLNAIQLFDIFRRNNFKLVKKELIMSRNKFLKGINNIINLNECTKNFIEKFPIIIPNNIHWEFLKE